MNRKYGAFSSSVNPQKLSLMWKGVLQLVPALVLVFNWYGVNIGEGEINQILSSFKDAAIAGFTFLSAIQVLWGGLRKLLVKYNIY